MQTPQEAGVWTSYLAGNCNKCVSTALVSSLSFLSDCLLPDDNQKWSGDRYQGLYLKT